MNRIARLGIVALAISPLGLMAQTLTTSQDAYYIPGNATAYGKAVNITVGASSAVGLVQFDLTGLPPGITASQVVKANLTLYANSVSSPGTINIDTALGSWAETTVSGTSGFPAMGGLVASAVPVSTAGTYVTVDVTSAVQNWINGSVNSGLMITANSGAVVQFDAKENTTTSHPAALNIVLSYPGAQGPAGPQGAQGPAGPAGSTGSTGAQGPAGANGNTLWNGTSAPGSGIGANGDFYLRTSTNCLYGPKASGAWPGSCTSLVGPTGPSGTAGIFGSNSLGFPGTGGSGVECTIGQLILSVPTIYTSNWIPADGRLLDITSDSALFTLIGTNYGGNGTTNFALPDLRQAAPNNTVYYICAFGVFP